MIYDDRYRAATALTGSFASTLAELERETAQRGRSVVQCHLALASLNEHPQSSTEPGPLYANIEPSACPWTGGSGFPCGSELSQIEELLHRGNFSALRDLRRRLAPRIHPHAVACAFADEAETLMKKLNVAIDEARHAQGLKRC